MPATIRKPRRYCKVFFLCGIKLQISLDHYSNLTKWLSLLFNQDIGQNRACVFFVSKNLSRYGGKISWDGEKISWDSGKRTWDGGKRTWDGGKRTWDGGKRTWDGGWWKENLRWWKENLRWSKENLRWWKENLRITKVPHFILSTTQELFQAGG